MKNNRKFMIIVVSLLLASVLLLAGCMYAIDKSAESSNPYEMDSEIASDDHSIYFDYYERHLSEMEQKFAEMCAVSKEQNTIMPVTASYLANYWKDNYEEEVVHSLTADEVEFIIQDSIKLYETYGRVAFPNFDIKSFNSKAAKDPEVYARIPKLDGQYVNGLSYYDRWDVPLDYTRYKSDIYEIIFLRIAALSSPKTFIYDEEISMMIDTVLPASPMNVSVPDSLLYPGSVAYIPSYNENTDRAHFVRALEGSGDPAKEDEWFIFSDLVSQIYFRTTDEENEIFRWSSYDCKKNDLYVRYPDINLVEEEHWANKFELEAEILQAQLTEKLLHFEEVKGTLTKEENLEYSVEIETLRNSLSTTRRSQQRYQQYLEKNMQPRMSYEEWLELMKEDIKNG